MQEAFALSNTTSDERRRRFLIGPDDYRSPRRGRASRQHADRLLPLASEPSGGSLGVRSGSRVAQHALRDRVGAGGRPEAARSWRLRDDRSAFDEEPMVVTVGAARAAQAKRA